MHSPIFSLEIFPPKRNAPVGTIYDTLDGLEGLHPDFISVTYGTGKSSDRTATARIAHTVKREYGIDAVAHLTAMYVTKKDVDDTLEMFREAGVSSILPLRGDVVEGRTPAGVFTHASDLAAYIKSVDPSFKLFGACYPEGHPQSASLEEDIENLRKKVDSGVTHLISQLFYSTDEFLQFAELARKKDITVPIEAGIMPPVLAKSTLRMAKQCQAHVPRHLHQILEKWQGNKEALQQAGIVYASEQISELIANGVDGIHLYSMNHPKVVRRIWNNVSSLFEVVE
ncbi:MAG: methylenetetrahydrofolate reductase [NAD(P)H] [Bifidobacteriaceae bacterium]|jgi:methylenetetrahydrofolate reductase (NADPH)|nr:methylenetetrahydrofolate reductase [NAD(P)H] [Bifidobacteriaceae bacterium]MCI1979295.1 methylenetetrahydrofolate reductase [NAD(P)H] [Bifidobacteriaceae bacterium]